MRASLRAFVFACMLILAAPLRGIAAPASPEPEVSASPLDTLEAFRDVPTDSFAYQAIQSLEADRLIQGYPDGTFKGKRPLTRYEAAVITQHVVAFVEGQLKSPATAQTVSADDVKALRVLIGEFKDEVASLEKRVAKIDDRVTNVEKTLGRQQVHVQYFLRAGTFRDQVSAYSGKGTALPGGTLLAANSQLGSGEKTKRNTLVSGLNQAGNGYQTFRFLYDGSADARISYHVQLENQLYFDTADASTNPAFGGYSSSGVNPPLGTFSTSGTIGSPYPANTTFRINYANVLYQDPSGLSVAVGRYRGENSDLGLNYRDYFNGFLVGYARKAFWAHAGYSFNFAAGSNGAPGTASFGTSGQTLLASAGYQFGKKLSATASWASDLGANETLWNPASGYQTSDAPINVGSVYAKFIPSARSVVEVEGLHRFGTDPFTGKAWQQPNALYAQVKYGDYAGSANGSYIETGFFQAGFNSLSGHTGVENTLNYYQYFLTNPNGYRSAYIGVHHWLSQAARVGLVYLRYDLIPGTDMPVQTASGGCAGNTCYVGRDNANALFLQTWVQF